MDVGSRWESPNPRVECRPGTLNSTEVIRLSRSREKTQALLSITSKHGQAGSGPAVGTSYLSAPLLIIKPCNYMGPVKQDTETDINGSSVEVSGRGMEWRFFALPLHCQD